MGNISSTAKNNTPVDNSLTGQIKDLQTKYDVPKIEKFYSKNLKVINKQIGNKELHDNLIALRDYLLKNSKGPKSRILAFQIYWTARSLLPEKDVDWIKLPLEIWKRIYSEECLQRPLTLANLLVSSQYSMIAHERMNLENICLKSVGFKNASSALIYVIKHKLSSADLRKLGKVDFHLLEELGKHCPDLKRLGIDDTDLSAAQIVPVLNQLLKLKMLDLKLTFESSGPAMLEPISKMVKLQALSLRNYTGDALELPQAIKNLSKLTCLHLDSSGIFDNTLLEALVPHTQLEALGLINCNCISGSGLVDVAKQQKNLKILELTKCKQISPYSIAEAVEYLPQLKVLDLTGIVISYEKMEKIIMLVPLIETVSVNGLTRNGNQASILKWCRAAQVPDFENRRVD